MKRRRYVVEFKQGWNDKWLIAAEFNNLSHAISEAEGQSEDGYYSQVTDNQNVKDNKVYVPTVVWESD